MIIVFKYYHVSNVWFWVYKEIKYNWIDKNCYQVLLDHSICQLILEILEIQENHITIVTMAFVFLDSLLGEGRMNDWFDWYIDEGLYQLCCQPNIKKIIQKIIDIHKGSSTEVATLGNNIISKLEVFNNTLYYVLYNKQFIHSFVLIKKLLSNN